MKKLLLSLLCLLAVAITASAEKFMFNYNDEGVKFYGSGTNYGQVTYKHSTSGIGFEGYASKNNGFNISGRNGGNYIAVTSNDNNYKIKTVTITAKTGANSATINVLSQDTPYEYVSGQKKDWSGTAVEGSPTNLLYDTDNTDLTFPIEAKYFVIYVSSSNAIQISDIEIVYEGLPTPVMSFPQSYVYGKTGVGALWQSVSVTDKDGNPLPLEDEDGNSYLLYSSDNEEVVKVDPKTGQIFPEDSDSEYKVLQAGTVEIFATYSNPAYSSNTVSYTLIIVDPEKSYQPGSSEFNFTTKDPYGIKSQTVGSEYQTNDISILDNENVDDAIVKIGFKRNTGNYRSWQNGTGESATYDLRLYNGSSFTVTVPENCKITNIQIVGSKIVGSFDPNGKDASANNWSPADDSSYSSVTFNATGTCTISQIVVSYDSESSDLDSANLSFSPTVDNFFVDQETVINAVNNPNSKVITYSIDGLDEGDYSIVPDAKTLTVKVKKPGYYTLKAESPQDEEFCAGFAIKRLNVFPHSQFTVNDEPFDHHGADDEIIYTANAVVVKIPAEIGLTNATKLYYKIAKTNGEEDSEEYEESDENCLVGYTYDEDGVINIPAKSTGELRMYLSDYGYHSPICRTNLDYLTANISWDDLSAEEYEGNIKKDGENYIFYINASLKADAENVYNKVFPIDDLKPVVTVSGQNNRKGEYNHTAKYISFTNPGSYSVDIKSASLENNDMWVINCPDDATTITVTKANVLNIDDNHSGFDLDHTYVEYVKDGENNGHGSKEYTLVSDDELFNPDYADMLECKIEPNFTPTEWNNDWDHELYHFHWYEVPVVTEFNENFIIFNATTAGEYKAQFSLKEGVPAAWVADNFSKTVPVRLNPTAATTFIDKVQKNDDGTWSFSVPEDKEDEVTTTDHEYFKDCHFYFTHDGDIYVKVVKNGSSQARRREAAANLGDGYVKVERSDEDPRISKPVDLSGATGLSIVHSVNGIQTAPMAVELGNDVTTGVEEIAEAAEVVEAKFFTLEGIEVKAPLAPGLYIRRAADKADVIMVK